MTPSSSAAPRCRALQVVRRSIAAALVLGAAAGAGAPRAACPLSESHPITSGRAASGAAPVVFGRLGPRPIGSFFLVGPGENHSAFLRLPLWLSDVGDVDGDGLGDYRVEAPGTGPGGWGDAATAGCPSAAAPPRPPLAVAIGHEREDFDGDGAFDVFEDVNRNGALDLGAGCVAQAPCGEDRDGDRRLTPPGGCEGRAREDRDCDGRLDRIHEDLNGNGRLDAGEDSDGDGRLDDINEDANGNGVLDAGEDGNGNGRLDGRFGYIEDRNANGLLDDRPFPRPGDVNRQFLPDGRSFPLPAFYPYESFAPPPGGIVIASVAWDGASYDLSRLTTPGAALEAGEDRDGDGAFDVFEDLNRNGALDLAPGCMAGAPCGEDRDGDRRLTPPDGCEGLHREDVDCDGRIDTIHEDIDGDGVLDIGEDLDGDHRLDDIDEDRNADGILQPGEDSNGNGILDGRGRYIEDRNGNGILDDRPRPRDGEVIDEVLPGGGLGRAPSTYPYGAYTPSGAVRLIAATRLDRIAPAASAARRKPDGTWRLRVASAGAEPHDDLGGRRDLFVRGEIFSLSEDARGGLVLDEHTACVAFFVETGGSFLKVPSALGGAFAAPASLVPCPLSTSPFPRLPVWARPVAAATEGGHEPPLPSLRTASLTDRDGDGVPLPFDNCPDAANAPQRDADVNGIGDACDPALGPGPAPAATWERLGGPGPGPRAGAAAAWDAARRVVVLFGGSADAAVWEFDGAAWRRVEAAPGPAARRGHRMEYDAGRRRVVLFGGVRLPDGTPLGDLWAWDGARWAAPATGDGPAPRSEAAFAYDRARDLLVLFGGDDGTRVLGDTWIFDGGAWRRVASPRSPSPRRGAAMTFDTVRGVGVLFGGENPAVPADRLGDLWEIDGDGWHPVDDSGALPPVTGAGMAHDRAGRRTLIFGGLAGAPPEAAGGLTAPTAATRVRDDRLQWWALPTRATIGPRASAAIAFDEARGALLAHGGTSDGVADDTWILRLPHDGDGDGIADADDACPAVFDPDQGDADADGIGDACDACAATPDPAQRDRDRDGAGDACDPDIDGDGVENAADACPLAYVDGRPSSLVLEGGGPDGDGDGAADDCDRCPADPANDVDGDGVCGDADVCPLAPDAAQGDRDGDGAGDACQPFVRIVTIESTSARTLNARVAAGDPDGDRLSGTVALRATTTLVDVLPRLSEACALTFVPEGSEGPGILFAISPDGVPVIADAATAAGCGDGVARFVIAAERCGPAAAFGSFVDLSGLEAPFDLCVRDLAGGDHGFTVWRLGTAGLTLAGEADLLVVPYEGRLPRTIDLAALPGPGAYVLRVSAGDGATPPAADARLFERSGEGTLIVTPVRAPRRE